MSAAHTVFVRTIIKVFFIIFLKDLWMVISLQSLSFPPILLFFLCPALFVSVCVDAVLSSQVPLTLPADVTEHVRGERNEKHQRLFEASLLHLLYMNNASASVAFRKKYTSVKKAAPKDSCRYPPPLFPSSLLMIVDIFLSFVLTVCYVWTPFISPIFSFLVCCIRLLFQALLARKHNVGQCDW